jgi:hypothetical protein
LKLKFFAIIIVSMMILTTALLAVIPYEQEEASLNSLVQNPVDKGACFLYNFRACCTTKEKDNDTCGHCFIGTFKLEDTGNDQFRYTLNETRGVNRNITVTQILRGNIVKYFIGNFSSSNSLVNYGSLALRKIDHSIKFGSSCCFLLTRQEIRYFNGEEALLCPYIPLNINNTSIEKNPARYDQMAAIHRSIIKFFNSDSYRVLECMCIEGGNVSFVNRFLGTKDKVICGFSIILVKTNVRFQVIPLFYYIKYYNYVGIVWIVGSISLLLTVRNVRKRIRRKGIN